MVDSDVVMEAPVSVGVDADLDAELAAAEAEAIVAEELSDVVIINGKEHVIPEPRAAQSAAMIRVISRVFLNARKEMASMKDTKDIDVIAALLAGIDEDTLITLAAASAGVDKKFANEHFSFSWVMPAIVIAVRKSDILNVISNFTSLLSPTARIRS